jgi:hypothetical protein
MLAVIDTNQVVQIDPVAITYIVGVLIPLITAIFTKEVASSRIKALFTFMQTIITGVLTGVLAVDGDLTVGMILSLVVNTLVAAVASYYGVLKPTGVAPALAARTANFGVGSQPPDA